MENRTKKNIGLIYFSPTSTTRKICQTIASGMGEISPTEINLTAPGIREKLISKYESVLDKINQLIVGAPVYEGKLPVQFIECLNALSNGKGKECTIVVVYGNRDFGIALRHMGEILTKKGFKITAAGAFIGEHSYSRFIPIAIGRPDEKDLELAFNFGKNCLESSGFINAENLPQQLDMNSKSKKYRYIGKAKFIAENCEQCGICAALCPTGIISSETGDFISKQLKDKCIGCMACVFNCKNDARVFQVSFIWRIILRNYLKKATIQRLEPLVVFP